MKRVIILLILFLAFLLRFYQLGVNPPSLYWDEASLGYNAYSILNSGRDEHGEFLPIARFIAFGDYKPPGYIYTTVPFILFFGLNEFSVRLTSALAGLVMVVVTYFLMKELFSSSKLSLLAAYFISVSPWAIHFSRGAFEANLAATFNLTAIYFFIMSTKKKWMIILPVIFFIFSFYTFNANRIIAPLILIMLVIFYFKDVLNNWKWTSISFILGVMLIFPSVSYLTSRESKLRFQEVSIFSNLEPIKLSNERIKLDNENLLANIIHNRRFLFTIDYLKHYLDNFSLRFLFTHGDVNPRLSSQVMGQLYVIELPLLLIGFYLLFKKRRKEFLLIFAWMLIAAIPAGSARETPHALRILSILPTYQIIIAFGLYHVADYLNKRSDRESSIEKIKHVLDFASLRSNSKAFSMSKINIFLFSIFYLLFSINIYYYLHDYYIHFPHDWSGEWQYGYKQMVNFVLKHEKYYDSVVVTPALGRPYIYFAFYKPKPQEEFIRERQAKRDWYGFWEVESLGKIYFDMDKLLELSGRILVVSQGDPPPGFNLLKKIPDLSGKEVFTILDNI